jgi:hypothetical protein
LSEDATSNQLPELFNERTFSILIAWHTATVILELSHASYDGGALVRLMSGLLEC